MASSRNWVFDVFPSFSGEDVRQNFLSHFIKELDRKLISVFKDSEIMKSQSIGPELEQAIRDSRIAVVVFSKNYASSSWCLDELLEIKKCKEELGQLVIPVFYGLDPSHVRKQCGEFGEVFENTCQNRTEEVKNQWKQALTDVANILGYHSRIWENEAKMIEDIANNVLDKLLLTTSKDFEDFVGIEDHIAKMSLLLHMECVEVRMVGIWGSSGIGKTTIARALFSRLNRHFQSSVFIDRAFISKSKEVYSKSNSDDYNMKLNLQKNFLSEILDKKDMKIDHLGALGERLRYHKVLILIDDLDDLVVLDALAGQTQWFGCGSRIIAVTKDRRILRAHGINHIYEVQLPSKNLALQMLCRSAFKKNSPPPGFMELAPKVVECVDSLPLGLNVLGKYLREIDEEDWKDVLLRHQNGIDEGIQKTLQVSYDGLNNKKDKALFRHIACLFNYAGIIDIKQLLADSELDVNIGLKILNDKSLIHISRGSVQMHHLLQEMGTEIVRAQSNEAGEREFLIDSEDICDVLKYNTGTKNVLGISLDIDKIEELQVENNSVFKEMRNLRFLDIYSKRRMSSEKEERLHLLEGLDYLPPKLRLLRWDRCPMRCMPSKFCPKYLVKLKMERSKLEKLWEGVAPLTCLNYNMNLSGSEYLKEIPDLSMATNLKTLNLSDCSSLVDLPLSIRNLNKLEMLEMSGCTNLRTLPSGINLQSLVSLELRKCSQLNSFPKISTNILFLNLDETAIEEIPSDLRFQNLINLHMGGIKSANLWERVQPLTPLMTMVSPSLKRLSLSDIPSLVELPFSIQNLNQLTDLSITRCTNLEILPTEINLEFLEVLNFNGCSRLKSFPDISTNITTLYLNETCIEEVPRWIVKFSKLRLLHMVKCFNLSCVSLNICKLKHLEVANFTLSKTRFNKASWCNSPSAVSMEADNVHFTSPVPKEDSSSLCVPKLYLKFINCFILGQEALLQNLSVLQGLIFPGEEVPSYFTHRTTGISLTIPLLHTSPNQPFLRFRACAVVELDSRLYRDPYLVIQICCRFRGRLGNRINSVCQPHIFRAYHQKGSHLFIFDCRISLNNDNAPPAATLTYDQVDIEFRIIEDCSMYMLKGCGIQIFEDHCPSSSKEPENVSPTLGLAGWALPHPSRGNIFKHLTLALNEAKQQFLKGPAHGV